MHYAYNTNYKESQINSDSPTTKPKGVWLAFQEYVFERGLYQQNPKVVHDSSVTNSE